MAEHDTRRKFAMAFDAIGKNDIEELWTVLREEGFDVNADFDQTTLLIEATAQGRIEMIELLLKYGADINQGSEHVVTPLCAAAAANQIRSVQFLLKKGCNLNKLADDRPFYTIATPLHFAILNKNIGMVKLLLDHGHDANYPSNNHNYPIVEAMRQNCPEIAKLLLNVKSCDVNNAGRLFGGYETVPPLHQCLFTYRRFDIAKLLLDSKRCKLTFSGSSYLSIMLFKAFDPTLIMHLKFIKMFLEAGCDMLNRDRYGRTPFTTLIDGNDSIFVISHMQVLMELLVRAGIRPSQQEAEMLVPFIRNPQEEQFYQWLSGVAVHPRSLQESCRLGLRRHFGIFPNDRLRQLPLPVAMLRYITLEYLQNFPYPVDVESDVKIVSPLTSIPY